MMVSLMKIPLMLTMCCHVWHDECKVVNAGEDSVASFGVGGASGAPRGVGQSSYFITCLYLKLFNITIKRTEKKHDDVREYLLQKLTRPQPMCNKPDILSDFGRIIDFFKVIEPSGKLFF